MIDVYSWSGLAVFITRGLDRLRTHPLQEPQFLLTYRFACRLNFRQRLFLIERLDRSGLMGVLPSCYQKLLPVFILARLLLFLPQALNLIQLLFAFQVSQTLSPVVIPTFFLFSFGPFQFLQLFECRFPFSTKMLVLQLMQLSFFSLNRQYRRCFA